MNKRPRGGEKAPVRTKPSSPKARARGERQETAFADARQLQERVEGAAAPASSRPRRAHALHARIDLAALSGIELTVPLPEAVSEAAIDARLCELLRARAPERSLSEGEPLALMDDVLLDAIGYCDGAPMSAHVDVWMRLAPNAQLPGLFEQIAAGKLGEPRVLRLVLPESFPDEDRRGQPAAFVVRTKAAKRASVPALDDEQAIAALGRGTSVAAARDSVKEELLVEDARALVEQAKRLYLEEAARRASITVDEDALEGELHRRWRMEEGDALALQGVSSEEQAAARSAFLAHPERQREARAAQLHDRLLGAVVNELGIDASPDDVLTLIVHAASATALPMGDLHTRLTADEKLVKDLSERLKKSEALHHLLAGATIRFGRDAPSA